MIWWRSFHNDQGARGFADQTGLNIRPCHRLAIAAPMAALAEAHILDVSKINFKPSYRTDRSAWNKDIRQARAILDDMAANNGQDTTLKDFNWEDLSLTAAYGETWIKKQDRVKFAEIIRSIEKSQKALEIKANEIQAVRDRIAKDLASDTARWKTLIAGDDQIVAYLETALGKKIAGTLLGEILKAIGKRTGSKLVSGAGKVLGPVSTLWALFDFFDAYDEYAEMKLMLDRMLERTEIIAYLDVLLKQYDLLIAAQDKIIESLFDGYDLHSQSTCR